MLLDLIGCVKLVRLLTVDELVGFFLGTLLGNPTAQQMRPLTTIKLADVVLDFLGTRR